jgi:hypothetical protein
MGEVFAFKLKPVIRVELIGAIWTVSIRPVPVDQLSMKSFPNEAAAGEYARQLRREHGWRITPPSYGFEPFDTPGAA